MNRLSFVVHRKLFNSHPSTLVKLLNDTIALEDPHSHKGQLTWLLKCYNDSDIYRELYGLWSAFTHTILFDPDHQRLHLQNGKCRDFWLFSVHYLSCQRFTVYIYIYMCVCICEHIQIMYIYTHIHQAICYSVCKGIIGLDSVMSDSLRLHGL